MGLTSYVPIFAPLLQPTKAQEVEWSKAGQLLYAQQGITTAHEGLLPTNHTDFVVALLEQMFMM